jgi:hypothetical protein
MAGLARKSDVSDLRSRLKEAEVGNTRRPMPPTSCGLQCPAPASGTRFGVAFCSGDGCDGIAGPIARGTLPGPSYWISPPPAGPGAIGVEPAPIPPVTLGKAGPGASCCASAAENRDIADKVHAAMTSVARFRIAGSPCAPRSSPRFADRPYKHLSSGLKNFVGVVFWIVLRRPEIDGFGKPPSFPRTSIARPPAHCSHLSFRLMCVGCELVFLSFRGAAHSADVLRGRSCRAQAWPPDTGGSSV